MNEFYSQSKPSTSYQSETDSSFLKGSKTDENAALPDERFFFESDHEALKNNQDYLNLMKYLCVLEQQRIKYVEQIDIVNALSKLNDKNPELFVQKLTSGELELPTQEIIDYKEPEIDWSKYNMKVDDDGNLQYSGNVFHPQTRNKNKILNENTKTGEKNDKSVLVRGRKFDDSKPETFNQLWTAEEQARLEELLVEYPPEKIEYRRWVKIAKALGNRTPQQVCSRMQKYFLKLHKAGLTVPGRPPRANAIKKSGKLKKIQHKKSTFFPKLSIESSLSTDDNLKVELNDSNSDNGDDDNDDEENKNCDIGFNGNIINSKNVNNYLGLSGFCDVEKTYTGKSNNSSISSDYNSDKLYRLRFSSSLTTSSKNEGEKTFKKELENDNIWLTEVKKLELLYKIRKSKTTSESKYRHFHFQCYQCSEMPIVGIRWFCETCKISYCSDCVIQMMDDNSQVNHPKTHAISVASVLDKDYRDFDYYPQNFKSTNHLDPNCVI